MKIHNLNIKISACVIVKNEAENLPLWLEKMSQLADEMIVVDTGSEDNTKELAVAAGAQVYDYQWQDDFAAAKNYAISKAKGDWILFLDADEYFDEKSCHKLSQVIMRHHIKKDEGIILCNLVNIDKDRHNKVIDTVLQARIFRNIPEIRYAGKIHESLANKGTNLKMVFDQELTILHTGYSSSLIKAKGQRNLPLLLEKEKQALEKNDDYELGRIYMQLRDAYHGLDEYETAIEYGYKVLETNTIQVGAKGLEYEIIISAMASLGKSEDELIAVLDEAIEKFPDVELYVLEKGCFQWRQKDYLKAEKTLNKGLKMREKVLKRMKEGKLREDSSLRLMPVVYTALGDISYQRGKKDQAAVYFAQGLEFYAYHPDLVRGLYLCLMGSEPADIIAILQEYFDRDKDWEYLIQVIGDIMDEKVLAYYLKNKKCLAANDYLQTGHYDAAAIEAAKEIRLMSNLLAAQAKQQGIETVDSQSQQFMKVLLPEAYKVQLFGIPAGISRKAMGSMKEAQSAVDRLLQ